VTRCYVDKHHPNVDYLIIDIVETFQVMKIKHPTNLAYGKHGPHPMFLSSKPK